jgi:hypothetical protein
MSKMKHPSLAGAIAAVALFLMSAGAHAQPGWGPGMMMGPGMMGGRGFSFMCNPRAAGFAEWRIDRIEADGRATDRAQRTADRVRQGGGDDLGRLQRRFPRQINRALGRDGETGRGDAAGDQDGAARVRCFLRPARRSVEGAPRRYRPAALGLARLALGMGRLTPRADPHDRRRIGAINAAMPI